MTDGHMGACVVRVTDDRQEFVVLVLHLNYSRATR